MPFLLSVCLINSFPLKKLHPFSTYFFFFSMQAFRKEREEKLIKFMKDRIQPFVDGRKDEFVKLVDSEARTLSTVG